MKMPTNAVSRRLSKIGLLAAVAAIGMAAMMLSPLGEAKAQSGRRICEYSFKAKPRHGADPFAHYSIVIDYKKDGACPYLSKDRLVATGYADVDHIFFNPVPKWSCEEWGSRHRTHLTYLGDDPCQWMADSHVYVLTWKDPTVVGFADYVPVVDRLGFWNNFS